MKKYLMLVAAVLLTLGSCQNSDELVPESPVVEQQATPLTLSVSLESADATRTAYTWEADATGGGILKCTWEEGDKVSVISYTPDGKIDTVDLFEVKNISDDGTMADFVGTFTGTTTENAMVVFPSLEFKDGNYSPEFEVWSAYKMMPYYFFDDFFHGISGFFQLGNDNTKGLHENDFMFAPLTLNGNKANVSFHHNISVFRLELDVTDVPTYQRFNSATISIERNRTSLFIADTKMPANFRDENGQVYTCFPVNDTYQDLFSSEQRTELVDESSFKNGQFIDHVGLQPDAQQPIVAYIPFIPNIGTSWNDGFLTVKLAGFDNNNVNEYGYPDWIEYGAHMQHSDNQPTLTMEAGKVYSIKAKVTLNGHIYPY